MNKHLQINLSYLSLNPSFSVSSNPHPNPTQSAFGKALTLKNKLKLELQPPSLIFYCLATRVQLPSYLINVHKHSLYLSHPGTWEGRAAADWKHLQFHPSSVPAPHGSTPGVYPEQWRCFRGAENCTGAPSSPVKSQPKEQFTSYRSSHCTHPHLQEN